MEYEQKLMIAQSAYDQIKKAINELQGMNDCYFGIPNEIELDGEVFYFPHLKEEK